MDTNNNFDSQKTVENENLNNDSEKKANSIKYKISSGFESIILVVLIIAVLIIVVSTFFEEKLQAVGIDLDEAYEEDYYESDYSYSDDLYSYDYSDDSYYTTETNTSASTITAEELMQSDLFNQILRETTQNTANITSENTVENVVENTVTEEISESIIEEENYYYEEELIEEALKDTFEEERKKLIVSEEGISVNKDLIISIDNQNPNLVYDLSVYAIFYKSNEIIQMEKQYVDVIASKNKKYLKLTEAPDEFDSYEIFITKDFFDTYYKTLLNNQVDYASEADDDMIKITLTNNSDEKIDEVDFTILYYDKENKLLDIEDNISDYSIKAGRTGKAKGYGPWDDAKAEYINYDHYEIILDFATVNNY